MECGTTGLSRFLFFKDRRPGSASTAGGLNAHRGLIMTIETNGIALETDDQGFLMDPEAWDDRVAEKIAHNEGVELGDEHRKVLEFIRKYFDEYRVAVDARFVIKYLADELGYGKRARQRLYELFPYGYMQQVCKIAGMRRPRAWSTG